MFYYAPIFFYFDEAELYGPTYIQCCEYFQLDPRVNYTFDQFNQRYLEILEKFKINPGLLTLKNINDINKALLWIKKRKNKLPLIVNYTTKLILQKKLMIPDGMIQEKFVTTKGLTKEAIKTYNRYVLSSLIGLIIGLAIVLGFIIILFL